MAHSGRRLLIGQGLESCTSGNNPAAPHHHFLTLPDPRTGQAACYLLTPAGLLELNHHRPQFGSWLVGESVVQEGGLYLATPVDPLLVLLPLLETARGPGTAGTAGIFVDLEQILSPLGYPSAPLLASLLTSSAGGSSPLDSVCDSKAAGGQTYYRLSEPRALAWLRCKVAAAAAALRASQGPSFGNMEEAAIRTYAAGLMAEYLSASWRQMLWQALGLPSEEEQAAAAAAAAASARAATWDPDQTPPAEKRPRLDPKEVAKQKAAEARQAAKAAKLAKEASGMRKLSSFFAPKAKK